jgi:hypothetical protein
MTSSAVGGFGGCQLRHNGMRTLNGHRRLRFAKIHALVASSSLQRSATETPAEIVGKLNNEINAAPH